MYDVDPHALHILSDGENSVPGAHTHDPLTNTRLAMHLQSELDVLLDAVVVIRSVCAHNEHKASDDTFEYAADPHARHSLSDATNSVPAAHMQLPFTATMLDAHLQSAADVLFVPDVVMYTESEHTEHG